MEKILIIGGVAAGATAAAKARRVSSEAQITMLEAGVDISFANCGLPYYIGGDIKHRSSLILQSPESFKEQYDVDVFTHTVATIIDREKKQVKAVDTRTGDAKYYDYDKLILAQGGRPIKPKIEGADLDHVFSLWTLDDMDKIKRFTDNKQPTEAVVVGGGFIGLEMVEALAKRGLKVHVVEMMPHVMSIMDAEIAGFIQQEMMAYGVQLHTGKSVTSIQTNTVKLDDGTVINAQMVIMSIGVRPTLQLAQDAGLAIGDAGGLLVDEYLQTSDESIYAAGDMVELEHRVSKHKVRIPLAGPANRQGRIAAENALGGKHAYQGSIGTSIVRVFEAVAGITGLSLKQARSLGIPADSVTVHKEHHTSYYPGSQNVTVKLIYNTETGQILGGQTAGYEGADRRLDVIATAIAGGLTVYDLADIDFAYSPPLGTANDALNMAAYTAENRMTGYSPSVTVAELDELIKRIKPAVIDVRDMFAYEKSHIHGSYNIPLEALPEQIKSIPKDLHIIIYDENGKKGHQALRMLKGAGIEHVWNISGGNISLQRQAYSVGFETIKVHLLPLEEKKIGEKKAASEEEKATQTTKKVDNNTPLVIDVRTPMEFQAGAYPDAINISLDELEYKLDILGDKNREITVYCATGARSAYARQVLMHLGFAKVTNGGGLMQMMMKR